MPDGLIHARLCHAFLVLVTLLRQIACSVHAPRHQLCRFVCLSVAQSRNCRFAFDSFLSAAISASQSPSRETVAAAALRNRSCANIMGA